MYFSISLLVGMRLMCLDSAFPFKLVKTGAVGLGKNASGMAVLQSYACTDDRVQHSGSIFSCNNEEGIVKIPNSEFDFIFSLGFGFFF
jgi:hypothetical protein